MEARGCRADRLSADEHKYVIWKERFVNQLSRVKVDAIPLNYVHRTFTREEHSSEEDLRRFGVTTAPADPDIPTDYEYIVITNNAKREAFRIMGDILERVGSAGAVVTPRRLRSSSEHKT